MSIKKGTMPPRYDETFKSGAINMPSARNLSGRLLCLEKSQRVSS